jgi:hypothetical protein
MMAGRTMMVGQIWMIRRLMMADRALATMGRAVEMMAVSDGAGSAS